MKKIFLAVMAILAVDAIAYDVEQVFRQERFSRGNTNLRKNIQAIDEAAWVWYEGHDKWGGAVFTETRPKDLYKEKPFFVRFRRDFVAIDNEQLELDVSADERYILLLDGKEISRGPHRGLPNHWHYQSYRITGLSSGMHRMEAICWQLGAHAPLAQVSIRGGFILKASGSYDTQLTTGKAEWKAAELKNTSMTDKGNSGTFGVGSQFKVVGSSLLDEQPGEDEYRTVVMVRKPVHAPAGLVTQGWMLYPTILRDMMFEKKTPGEIKKGPNLLERGVTIGPHQHVRALWDLGNYYCAYPFMRVNGGKGAKVKWGWTECLRDSKGRKKDRAAFEGVDFTTGLVDMFLPDGHNGALFTTPWWRGGRWCLLEIETADAPLTLESIEFAETRYPVKLEAKFECDDPLVAQMHPLCERALEMCMHEMFFDCPFYEQQMYPGDGRLHFQTAGLFDLEDRLVRHAITLYDFDRRENGMISMNCPTRGTQDGFGFTECEIFMHRDYMLNHSNRAWLEARLPGMNHTLMGFDAFCREDGLLVSTPGWNFVDWVTSWDFGVPPDGNGPNPNAEINLQYLNALLSAAECERAVGHEHLARHWLEKADKLKVAIRNVFWCPEKSLFASSVAKKQFSEHSQSLALLCDVLTGDEAQACFNALVETPDIDRGTIYYKHYLFETFFKFGRGDLFFKNLGFWKDCIDWHLSTILETPGMDSRSDCHGWGAHPLWHLHTGVAGVKSAAPFYRKVLVAPQPGHLTFIKSSTPTPKGMVKLDLRFNDDKVSGIVALPKGLEGEFEWKGRRIPLKSGSSVTIQAGM